jgi:hypothetical protein
MPSPGVGGVPVNRGGLMQAGGEQHQMVTRETASAAVAAKAQADVQARFVMAMRNPRDWEDVRIRMNREIERQGFAEVAMYAKPVGGGKVTGLTIRYAEAALRCMRNCFPETQTIWDDDEKRIVRVSLTDLEANLTYSKDITIDKTVERKSLKAGQMPLRTRQNSQGELTYLVPATEDDLLNKENSLVSKALRNHILRLLPGDIQDEHKRRIVEIQRKKDAENPDAAKKKICDNFGDIGILPSQLAKYLGKDNLDFLLPAELEELRAIYAAVSQGEANWADVMAVRYPEEATEGASGSTEEAAGTKRVKDLIDKRKQKQAPPLPPPAATTAAAAPADPQNASEADRTFFSDVK